MKSLFALIIALCSTLSFGQNATNIYAVGLSGNPGATPQIAGNALYAHLLNDGSGTYAFTDIDVLPTTRSPFTVTTNIGGGIAQKLFTIGKVPLFIPTSAGVSFNGVNTGWKWDTGIMAPIKLKGNWRILPNVRVSKSSVSNGTGYQLIPGAMIAWGDK